MWMRCIALIVGRLYEGRSDVPRYQVDLDLPPEQRWNEIVDIYRERVVEIEKKLDKDVCFLSSS